MSPRHASSPSPVLHLQVLGVPTATVHGEEAHLPLQRAVALLAYLAFQGQPVPRTYLAGLLWPDVDETTARARLRRLVYKIEEAVGEKVLAATDALLSLAPGAVEVDALLFMAHARHVTTAEALDGALVAQARQWATRARRPLLQGVGFGSGPFDDWLAATSIELQRLHLRLLERLADALAARGELAQALECAEALVELDVCSEPAHVLLMQLHARLGHAAGVEAAYTRCAEVLRAEFGIRPGPRTEEAYQRLTDGLKHLASSQVARPAVRYARSRCGFVAYTVFGQGPRTLVVAPGFVGQIEIALEYRPFREAVEALANRFRVVLFDRGGVGLSERLGAIPTPEAMAGDVMAILDDARVGKAWLFGSSEGGLGAMRLAMDHPARVDGLCLFGALARGSAAPDYPWALPPAAYDVWLRRLVEGWGGPAGIETFAPSQKDNPALRAWWARIVRHAASPGALQTILAGLRDADLRADLPRIAVPTLVMHRRGDRAVRFAAGEHLARSIAGATWCPLEGDDHFWWCGDAGAVVQAILAYTDARGPP
jgi:DNA-binding SARP family transcriptional activator/pimeloyl-ACP methyl ester carboxylesterase